MPHCCSCSARACRQDAGLLAVDDFGYFAWHWDRESRRGVERGPHRQGRAISVDEQLRRIWLHGELFVAATENVALIVGETVPPGLPRPHVGCARRGVVGFGGVLRAGRGHADLHHEGVGNYAARLRSGCTPSSDRAPMK